jgi:methylamine dehydrogenase light chain
MRKLDGFVEELCRSIAQHTSRRSFISRLGAVLAAPAIPLLPISRGLAADAKHPLTDFERNAQSKDPTKCDYWRHCAMDGALCGCCGGGLHTCPPGAEPSPTFWIGTCRNPDDGESYVIAYRDCCGKSMCAVEKDCECESNDGELPLYRPPSNNDIIWCLGSSTSVYHCTTSALLGRAS